MWNFIWWFIGDLFVKWAISASEDTVYSLAYLLCLAFITAVYFFLWYKIYLKVSDFFFCRHLTIGKVIIILVMLIISFVIFWVLLKSIYLHEICDWFGSIMAKLIHPWYWEWWRIDLDWLL